MGCDVHCVVEVKLKDGRWLGYNQPEVERNYDLFARMADVRNRIQSGERIVPIDQPRGVPGDASELTRMELDRWGSDAHSLSWLSAAEVDDLREWAEERRLVRVIDPYLFGYVCGSYFAAESDMRRPYVDARMVFWFDN